MDTTSSVLVMQDQISTLEMTVRQREEEIKRLSGEFIILYHILRLGCVHHRLLLH